MIETKIIEWLDFGDSIQTLDIYSKKYFLSIFKFLRILVKNKSFSIIINIIFTILFFIQIWTISLINVDIEKEFLLDILNYLKNFTLLYEIITDSPTYKILFLIFYLIILLQVVLIIIVFLLNDKIKVTYFALIINLLNIIFFYYLIGPAIIISLLSIWCDNGIHKYLRLFCFKNTNHIAFVILSFIMIILFFCISFLYSFYCNEIDLIFINSKENKTRIGCNYEIYCLISKISLFIFGFIFLIIDYEEEEHFLIKYFYEGFIFIICLIMSIYSYKNVYYYNKELNILNHLGWYFSTWFSLCILLKSLLNLTGISNFISIGWIIITFAFSKATIIKENLLISDTNIFELNDLKNIEKYKNILLKILSNKNNRNNKIILLGINKKFEEYIINNPEINFQYQNLKNNKKLIKKYNKKDSLLILTIIYIIYSFYSEKLTLKNELIIHMCYFLINKFNNYTYAMFLCSKLKSEGHKDLYYKYLLSEDIKEYLTLKLNTNKNKESFRHIQIGSVILYYLYIDLFKIKIYDGLSNQIDYFDLLKNSTTTNKTTKNFLKCGENILKACEEIKIIWDKLIELNPFSDEYQKDYINYLDDIVQDKYLAREESKKYKLLKNNKSKEKYNKYHNMFLRNTSSVLLIDGYLSNEKILYVSQNFPFLFMYSGKEILNLTIDNLLPNCIQSFHKELINNAIKYTNIEYIFKEPKYALLKNKMNSLFNIKLFVKPVPNLTYGLIYFSYIQKIREPTFIIVLDKDLKINGFTEISQIDSSFTLNDAYNLNHNILGYHIGLIIPDILLLLEYKNDEYNIVKKDCELKGYIYPVDKIRDIKNKVDKILEKIKNNKIDINDYQGEIDDDPQNIGLEFNELISEFSYQKIKPFSIFYKIQLKTFIDGKYKYYKVYINDDIISGNENNLTANEILDIFGNLKNKNKINNNNSKESIKQIKINFEEKNKKLINNQKDNEISNESKHSKNTNEINNKNNENENKNKLSKNYDNIKDKAKEKQNKLNYINSISNKKTKENISLYRYNKIRNNIIKRKESFPYKIMKLMSLIFGISVIALMVVDIFKQTAEFNNLSKFLSNHLIFNQIKINSAVLYAISVNIRWLSHSLYMNSLSHLNQEWSTFFENILEESIHLMELSKDFSSFKDDNYQNIINKEYELNLYVYKFEEKESYNYTLDNIFSYIINNGIKLMDSFDFFINYECKEIPKELGIYEINLKNLIEQAYNLYNLNLDNNNEEEEKNQAGKYTYYFPFSFLFSVIILICILIVYIYFTISLHNIEIEFLEKLINFNSIDFDDYIKKLDELKKKLRNDNNDEGIKEEEIESNNLDTKKKNEENEENYENIEEKHSKEIIEKKINKKKMKNKQNKILQQRKKKLNFMISFFRKRNIFFLIKVFLIFLSSLIYYINFSFISRKYGNDLINFDILHDSLNKVYSDSFEIFISLKRELDYYENNLIDCKTMGNFQPMNLEKISNLKIPKFGNLIMQISSNSDCKKETLERFNSLYSNNACKEIMEYSHEIIYCENFWSGVLSKGMEQAITQMGAVIRTVLDEIQSINNEDNNRRLFDLIKKSSFIEYEQFNEYYLFKAYNKTAMIFTDFRSEKLNHILRLFRILLYIYIIISFALFCLLFYFVYSFNYLFSSFINFIGILPLKFLLEDDNFYKVLVKFGDKYF